MEIKKLVNSKTLLFAGLLATIIVMLLLLLRPKSKPGEGPSFGALESPIIQPLNEVKQPSSQAASFTTTSLPKNAKIYRQNPYSISQEQMSAIAQEFGLTQGSFQGKLFIAQEENKYFAVNPDNGIIFLTQPLPDYLLNLNQEALENYALSLVKPTLLEEQIWENPQVTTVYFKGEGAHDALPGTRENATIAEVNIFPTIDGIRIVGKNLKPLGDNAPVNVKYMKQEQVVTLRTSAISVNFAESGTYPLNSLDKISQQLSQNQAVITSVIPEGRTAKDIGYGEILQPGSVEYTDIKLVYYYDPNPNALMQPMYLLTGPTFLEDGSSATVKAILPGIDPQYLKTP